jgi:hypothetical protein
MGTVRILFPLPTRSTNTPTAVALLDVPRLERRELAPAQSAAQTHRQNRAVPFSFGGLEVAFPITAKTAISFNFH